MRCNRCLQTNEHILAPANAHAPSGGHMDNIHTHTHTRFPCQKCTNNHRRDSLFSELLLPHPKASVANARENRYTAFHLSPSCDTSLLDKAHKGELVEVCVWVRAYEWLKWKCNPSLQGPNHSRSGFIRWRRQGKGVGGLNLPNLWNVAVNAKRAYLEWKSGLLVGVWVHFERSERRPRYA